MTDANDIIEPQSVDSSERETMQVKRLLQHKVLHHSTREAFWFGALIPFIPNEDHVNALVS